MIDLYMVYAREPVLDAKLMPDAIELGDGHYLLLTEQSRSQLYHEIKRRFGPKVLMVAPLAGLPKFKGMKAGAASKVKGLGET